MHEDALRLVVTWLPGRARAELIDIAAVRPIVLALAPAVIDRHVYCLEPHCSLAEWRTITQRASRTVISTETEAGAFRRGLWAADIVVDKRPHLLSSRKPYT